MKRLDARTKLVSPGLRSRPSLSGTITREPCLHLLGVAGTTVPAFVERQGRRRASADGAVSPGLRSRPSLSVRIARWAAELGAPGVAGTTVPAFVERSRKLQTATWAGGCRRDYGPGLR